MYDKEDCKVKDWDAPLTFGDGDSKSFSLLRYVCGLQAAWSSFKCPHTHPQTNDVHNAPLKEKNNLQAGGNEKYKKEKSLSAYQPFLNLEQSIFTGWAITFASLREIGSRFKTKTGTVVLRQFLFEVPYLFLHLKQYKK